MGQIIRFYGKYQWLSNYHLCNINYNGVTYSSIENAYQAQKISGNELRKKLVQKIFTKIDSNEAKIFGSYIPIREDWQEVKYKIMEDLLRIKFNQQSYKIKLLQTEGNILINQNKWCDIEYGVCYCAEHNGIGENRLGEIIMQIRKELKDKEKN